MCFLSEVQPDSGAHAGLGASARCGPVPCLPGVGSGSPLPQPRPAAPSPHCAHTALASALILCSPRGDTKSLGGQGTGTGEHSLLSPRANRMVTAVTSSWLLEPPTPQAKPCTPCQCPRPADPAPLPPIPRLRSPGPRELSLPEASQRLEERGSDPALPALKPQLPLPREWGCVL